MLAELAGPALDLARDEDRDLPHSPARIRVYWPEIGPKVPVLVYFHGGGWVLGDLDTMDRPCRFLANRAGCIVVSVDYRPAREHKFPAAVEDAYSALTYLAAHAGDLRCDPERIAVGGDSAGGNLSAAVAILARDNGGPRIAFQLLVYPATDAACERLSMQEFAEDHLLTRAGVAWFWNHYLAQRSDGLKPLASPLRAASLCGLPPAMVITAECDPVRDRGEAFAAALREAQVPVILKRYAGAIHGFLQMGTVIDAGREALEDAANALREAFQGTPVKS